MLKLFKMERTKKIMSIICIATAINLSYPVKVAADDDGSQALGIIIVVAVVVTATAVDLALLPFTISYDLIHSKIHNHQRAAWDAQIKKLDHKLKVVDSQIKAEKAKQEAQKEKIKAAPAERRCSSYPQPTSATNSARLIHASKDGNLAAVQSLIAEYANVNAYTSDGITPIYAASKNGYLKIVKYLFEHCAQLGPVGLFDQTPLYAASAGGNLDIVKYLLKHGADPLYKNNIGQTALDVVCRDALFKSFCPQKEIVQVISKAQEKGLLAEGYCPFKLEYHSLESAISPIDQVRKDAESAQDELSQAANGKTTQSKNQFNPFRDIHKKVSGRTIFYVGNVHLRFSPSEVSKRIPNTSFPFSHPDGIWLLTKLQPNGPAGATINTELANTGRSVKYSPAKVTLCAACFKSQCTILSEPQVASEDGTVFFTAETVENAARLKEIADAEEKAKAKHEEELRYKRGQILWVPENKLESLMPELSASHNDFNSIHFERIIKIRQSCWQNLAHLTSAIAHEKFRKAVGQKPQLPHKLSQGKYESHANFEERVAETRKKYNQEVHIYNDRIKNYHLLAEDKNRIIQKAFLQVFGSPKVKKTHYDPDKQIFSVEVVSDSPYAKDYKQMFVLNKRISNDAAPGFDGNLKNAVPRILFQRVGSKLNILQASFKMNALGGGEKSYSARPVKASSVQQALAQVDLKGLDAPIEEPIQELKIHYSADALGFHSDIDKPSFPPKPERPDDFALIVGVESYQDKNLPPAEFATRDAETVARYLKSLGIPKDHLILLTGDNATSGKINGYLQSWLPKNVSRDSQVYFYFSGHGSPDADTKTAYIVPWDGDPQFLRHTAISLKNVYSDLGKLKAKHVLVALDSCFSGAGGRSVIQSGTRPLVSVKMGGNTPPNMTVIAASQSNEIANSLETQGHGIFTYYFLKGLDKGFDDAHALCQYLKPEVKKASALENRIQIPMCHGPDFKFW